MEDSNIDVILDLLFPFLSYLSNKKNPIDFYLINSFLSCLLCNFTSIDLVKAGLCFPFDTYLQSFPACFHPQYFCSTVCDCTIYTALIEL